MKKEVIVDLKRMAEQLRSQARDMARLSNEYAEKAEHIQKLIEELTQWKTINKSVSGCCGAKVVYLRDLSGLNGAELPTCSKCGAFLLDLILHPEKDPIAQVFRDFYTDLMQPNDDGETRPVDYAFWAKQIRMLQVADKKTYPSPEQPNPMAQTPEWAGKKIQAWMTVDANGIVKFAIKPEIIDKFRGLYTLVEIQAIPVENPHNY